MTDRPVGGWFPATDAQHRLWLVDAEGPRGIEFSYPYVFGISGPLDMDRFRAAWVAVVERHTPLRTTFEAEDGELWQHVHRTDPAYFFIRSSVEAGAVSSAIDDEIYTPFDIALDWPIRVRLFEHGLNAWTLLVVVHHIATDGVSMQIMLDEVGRHYGGGQLPALTRSYLQLETAAPAMNQQDLDFWRELVAEARPVSFGARPGNRRGGSFSGKWLDTEFNAEQTRGLAEAARQTGTSVYGALLTVLGLAVSRRVGQDSFVMGVPFAGRDSETDKLIGFFVNLLPVPVSIDESAPFRALLSATGERLADCLSRSLTPLASIVSATGSRGVADLLAVTLTEENTPTLRLDGAAVSFLDHRIDVARYSLAVDYRITDSGRLRLEVSYAKDVLTRADVSEIVADMAALVTAMIADLDGRPVAVALERPGASPAPVTPVAEPASLPELWSKVVSDRPEAVAVSDRGGALTFGELDQISHALGVRLRAAGVGEGDGVAIALDRGRDFVVALLAVLRTGAHPVLLDNSQPEARLSALARAGRAKLALRAAGATAIEGCQSVAVDATPADQQEPGQWADRRLDGIAYVVFTSGSSGTPKAVAVTDRNLLALVRNLERLHLAGPSQSLGLVASFGFDASVQQWSRLFTGSRIHILDEQERLDPDLLTATVVSQRLDEIDISPRHLDVVLAGLEQALERSGSRLRVLVGGERIEPRLWRRLAEAEASGRLTSWNMYGPAECAVDSTTYPVGLADSPTIGVALPGVASYVLDSWLRPVPDGADGMLWIAGAGVSAGYLSSAGLTAAAFVADPFAADGSRMYRTGDVVRRDPAGRLVYVGRRDDQVKLNGFRVDLAEIEQTARRHPGVVDCAALPDQSSSYVDLFVVSGGQPAGAAELTAWLASQLPAHMAVRQIRFLDALPTLRSGKLDRAALRDLPGRDLPAPGELPVAGSKEAPAVDGPDTATSTTRQLIATVWCDVLQKDDIGEQDDFFSLGGHSLLAIKVAARVRKQLGVALPISAVFEYPRLSDLAQHVDQLTGSGN